MDPSSNRPTYFLQKADPVPDTIALTTGDIIQNLRSALDHLAYQLFVRHSGTKASNKHVYFPIAPDAARYPDTKERCTRGISPSDVRLIDSVAPYRGGNDDLWRIHALNNADKHRILVTVGSSYQSFDAGADMMAGLPEESPLRDAFKDVSILLRPAHKICPLTPGVALYAGQVGTAPNPDMKFNFNVALHEPDIIENADLVAAIGSMIQSVDTTLGVWKH